MKPWKRTLYVLWAGQFLLLAGVSLVAPFLPLYLGELGVTEPTAQVVWSGVIFAINYVAAAIFQPIWGELADRYGRKLMAIRSALGIGTMVGLFAVAPNVWWLLLFRVIQGVMVGYSVAANALISAQAPAEKQGYVLGIMHTGWVAGTVSGPLIGGVLAHLFGRYRPVFLVTLVACWLTALLVWLFVEEKQPSRPARVASRAANAPVSAGPQRPERLKLAANGVLLAVIVVSFVANFSNMTIEPILTLFLKSLDVPRRSLDLYAGVVFAVTGLASFIAAPWLGVLGDRYGHRKVLLLSLGGAAVIYFGSGFVTAAWQLVVLRFLLGLGIGGIMPAVNALTTQLVPEEQRGRGFGFTLSANFWGNVVGPLVGSGVAAAFGTLRAIFPVTAAVVLMSLLWIWLKVPERIPTPVVRGGAADGGA